MCDETGHFEIAASPQSEWLIFSLVGYRSDTLQPGGSDHLEVSLVPGHALDAVEISGYESSASLLEPINQVTIDEHELTRGACCNLSESFETTADVDVEFTDAISGARQVRMLGLDGRYIQLLSENRPAIRGMALPFGLTYVPGTWMSSIQITKGPGSVVNGYESMSGQINVEYKRPENMEKFNLNVYGSVLGRAEANAFGGIRVSEKIQTALFGHAHWIGRQNDHQDDGFLDLPLTKMAIAMNRWSFTGEGNWHGEAGVEYIHQDLFGGQLDSRNTGISERYSNPIEIRRGQVFAKTGWISPRRKARSTGMVLQANWHDQNSRYGDRHDYTGQQRTLHVNLINDIPLGSGEVSSLRTGASFLMDDLTEILDQPLVPDASSARVWTRTETVPGVFAEYRFDQREWILIAGLRADQHNLLGTQITPRLHLRKCWEEKLTIRFSGGRGFRTVNPVSEFSNWLNSSRRFERDSALLWESSWNAGSSVLKAFTLGQRDWTVRVDYYYTYFAERAIADLDSDPEAITILQSDDASRSHAAQLEFEGELAPRWTLKAAGKFEDVRSETAGALRRDAFVPLWRGLFSTGYRTAKEHWQADATLQIVGPSRLPLSFAESTSPVFPQLMAQITRNFENWSLYAGSENITGFTQHHAIRGAEDPFGSDFDAAGLWGPVMGRNVYAGIRWIIP